MKYRRIEKKVDRIIELLETIASRLPQQAAIDKRVAQAPVQLASAPPPSAPAQATLTVDRDPLALLEDREEWRKVIEGWEEPAGFPKSPK